MKVSTAGNMKPSPPRPSPDSGGNIDRVKWVHGGGADASAAKEIRKGNNVDGYEDYGMRRIRKAEKVEKLIHLVCWGPK